MLVIFDCDGVLVHSELLAAEVFSECLQAVGVPFSAEQCHQTFCGWTLPECFNFIAARGYTLPSQFRQQLFAREEKVFAERLQAVAGVESVLEGLRDRAVSYCVASNGALAKVERSLSITGLSKFFQSGQIFSAEFVARGKPAPDLFLLAAESLGVPARYCVVVEDSRAGMDAAVAAGMRTLCYGSDANAPEGITAFDDMQQLWRLLER